MKTVFKEQNTKPTKFSWMTYADVVWVDVPPVVTQSIAWIPEY